MSFGLPKFTNPLQQPGVSNVSTRDMSAPNVIKMSIVPVDEPFNRANQLLLNPSSISESKAANWVKHYVPGQSDPLMQWINGTERTVSFTAYVTKDIATNPTLTQDQNAAEWSLVIRPELDQQGQTAGGFNSSSPILAGLANNAQQERLVGSFQPSESTNYWSRSIQPQLDFYRSLVIPRENNSSRFVKTPPLVRLQMGTLLGKAEVVSNQKFILMTYSINITEFSPQLEPTKAAVTFTFVEYMDTNRASTAQEDESGNAARGAFKGVKIDNSTTIASGIRGVLG
jgi:hypothetical protein